MTQKQWKRKIKWDRLAMITGGAALGICALVMGTSLVLGELLHIDYSAKTREQTETTTLQAAQNEQTTPDPQPAEGLLSMHFNGVGDNLLHDVIFVYHEMVYGDRDFSPIYENTRSYVQNADLAYINFETICAGDAHGLSGYPNFNGPTEMIDTLAKTGYDWFSTSSNHSMDRGLEGLMDEMAYIEENHPGIVYTGTHKSATEAEKPVVIDVNGIRVGLAGFTYGLNGYTVPEGNDWLIDVFLDYDMQNIDYSLLDARIDALQDVSDVQIVSMHWGEEYQTVPNELQKEAAKHLNEKGVEVIIGSHPHVIQPVEWIKTEEQTTLCYYSLGNFLSAQDQNDRMVGGMADFDLSYDTKTKEVTFSNVKFIPTITWISSDLTDYRTYTISEYNDDAAASHYITTMLGQDCSPDFVKDYVADVIKEPEGITIVYE